MSAHTDIETQLAAYQAESAKFEAGNAAAGTRAVSYTHLTLPTNREV